MHIDISRALWTSVIMTAFELYEYANEEDHIICSECLGGIWGDRDGDIYRARFATTTQLIEKRDETCVVGPDPFKHLIHNAWAALDVADGNYLGGYHSHPWNAIEIKDYLDAGESDDIFWQPSDTDKASIPPECIEVILSIRPLTTTATDLYTWKHRGDLLSGKIDIAHITFSGWFMNEHSILCQVPVRASFLDSVNNKIDEIDNRS